MGHQPHPAMPGSGGGAKVAGVPPLYTAAQRLSGRAPGGSLHPAGPRADEDGTGLGARAATTAAPAAAGELPPPRQEFTFSGVDYQLRRLKSCPASALGAGSPPAALLTAAGVQAGQLASPGPAAATDVPLYAQQHWHGHSAAPPGGQGPSSQNGLNTNSQQRSSAGGSRWAGFAPIRPNVDDSPPGPVSVDLGMGGGTPIALQRSVGTAMTEGALALSLASASPYPVPWMRKYRHRHHRRGCTLSTRQ